jgi:hypothetical protein
MTSPNLAITHVAAAQNQKEVTVNDAINALDRALTDALSIDFAGGPVTLTAAQFRQAISFKPSATLSKLLESGQREQGVLVCRGQILQVDDGRQVLGQGE